MKVQLRSHWVNGRAPGFWDDWNKPLEVELPDGARVVGVHPSSVGYEVIVMEEVPDE